MRFRVILTPLVIIAAGFVLFSSCEKAVSPESTGLNTGLLGFGPIYYDSLLLKTGNGACGGPDTVVMDRYSPAMGPLNYALIGGGNTGPGCACDSIATFLPGTLPVTTMNPGDSVGWFDVYFELPAFFSDVMITLSVIADDGAEIQVNNIPVDYIDLTDATEPGVVKVREVTITGDSLFVEGMNMLTFKVVNTNTGFYGEPVPKLNINDCLYLSFTGRLDFAYEVPCDVEIDIKPGSDENPINCKSMKGVIPVAILTNDCLDIEWIDHTTVTFGPAGASEAHSNKHGIKRHVEDVDGDGDMDLVFHFRGYETGIVCGDTTAVLRGMTYDGREFEVTDHIRTVPWGECDSTMAGD